MIDYKLLQEDISFPIIEDKYYHSYIWDSEVNMVADFDDDATEEEYQSILGEMKDFKGRLKLNHYYMEDGDFYRRHILKIVPDVYIGCVRGWGRLQQKDNSEKRQDNIAEYILMCLNTK